MALPEGVPAGTLARLAIFRLKQNGWRRLVAEAGADGDAFTANGAAAAEHGGAGFGLHPRAKAVSLNALAAIGLKCALGHEIALLISE
jgi:hypothetical protein